MPEAPIRVLVVDDHEVVRAGVCALLGAESDLRVVGAVRSAQEAVHAVAARAVEVVVLDYRLPDADGAAALEQIRRASPSAKVIVLTAWDSPEVLRAAVAAGARGYLPKDAGEYDLAPMVRAVSRGHIVIAPACASTVAGWAQAAAAGPSAEMGQADVEMLRYLAQGLSNREIGTRTHLSEHTVKVRLRGVMARLGVHRRSEAVAAALRRGLI